MNADTLDEARLREALREVIDPELGINIVDLGLIYELEISRRTVRVTMTMTTPACPMGAHLREQVQDTVQRCTAEGVQVDVTLVWDPPWHPGRIADSVRTRFGWDG